ncbi:AMP-binding enzyme, partial [Acinetobacter baumannii]|uniref:AMP-binding enzyme n=1 Tax=Acinetobacter baumannii TaxID=470 RepID=UPI003F680EC3
GERVTSLVVPQDGADLMAATLEVHCRSRLAGFKTPKQFIIETQPLPRTPTGKVQKFLLVERFGKRGG